MIKRINSTIEAAAGAHGDVTFEQAPPKVKVTKLATLVALLSAPCGTTIAQLMAATGWQQHSVRGAMAGALKKRGHVVVSEKVAGERRYWTAALASQKAAA